MKSICVLGVCIILGLWVLRVAHSAASATPAAAPPPEVGPTDLVASFYKALLQKEEPTLAQETSLFGEKPGLRGDLPASDQGKGADPVILRFFRKHRDWFLPLGKLSTEQYLSGIQISSPFHFVQTVQGMKNKNVKEGRCLVMAKFARDYDAKIGSDRTLVFPFEDGKISAGGIRLGGFDGESVIQFVQIRSGVWGPRPKP